MSDIFISYSHQDKEAATQLIKELTLVSGKDFFIDSENIRGGDDWANVIVEAIGKSKTFIVLCSENSNLSTQVLSEIVIARNRKKVIIPVLLNHYNPIGAMEYHLSAYQQVAATSGINKQVIKEILHKLESQVDDNIYQERLDFYPPKNINIKGPEIFETKDLLKMNYSVNYISMKHIELDYLTVNRNKYIVDDEIEGTMDDWLEMISETEDCTAQLVANNQVVGYMDFTPVSPENYDLLVSNQRYFSSEVIEYYSYGGNYDVYVSMFSIDINYATPNNYFLFFSWMINKIEDWKNNGIFINRITFSIYMDSQAKALSALGFKLILNDKIKGMLYEAKVDELLANPIVINKIKKENYFIKVCSPFDKDMVDKCDEIAKEYSVNNGGPFHFENLIKDSDIFFTYTNGNDVRGYIAIKRYPCFKDDLYIEQIAIKKDYLRTGIASKLINYVISYFKKDGVNKLILNIRKNNYPSFRFFYSIGAKEFKMDKEIYLELGFQEEDIDNNSAYYIQVG